ALRFAPGWAPLTLRLFPRKRGNRKFRLRNFYSGSNSRLRELCAPAQARVLTLPTAGAHHGWPV
ncbi:hypothetical protein ACX6XY_25530, partial [Streptomyces sp. O3]